MSCISKKRCSQFTLQSLIKQLKSISIFTFIQWLILQNFTCVFIYKMKPSAVSNCTVEQNVISNNAVEDDLNQI